VLTAREQSAFIALGTIFLFLGIPSCVIALFRSREHRRILGWFGVFSTLYGVRLFAEVPAAFGLVAASVLSVASRLVWLTTYLILIPGALFWAELSRGAVRRFFEVMALVACAIAVAGGIAVALNAPLRLIRYNNIVVISLLLVLAVVSVFPGLAKKYLAVQSWLVAVSTVILAVAVIHDNLMPFLPLRKYPFFEPVAMALFMLSQAWIAAEKIFTDRRRLLSIENELSIAREIQASILPASVPNLERLRISAAYLPMTAVAGDFYWFISVEENRAGFLVADVSGHGVPAALIASMIKVAMQSVLACAHDPAAVLQGLERTLSGQLKGQFVSAAYLWLDLEKHEGAYSAAGHPPLLYWHDGQLERVESNGTLIGVVPDNDFPVRRMSIQPGDRFLLYTDGLSEPENAAGVSFGEHMETVIRRHRADWAPHLCDQLLLEVRRWQPASLAQQDDITLIVVDVL